jgi:serine/threonine protein kinase
MLKTETIDTTCMGCFAQLESSGTTCPVCGYNEAAQVFPPHHLRPRTILNGKFLLGKVLGEGGFGITYIGWDLNLDIKVAIKEYYPTGFVTRETTTTNTVQAYIGPQGDFFTKGRKRFVDEAKRLAKFRSMPGIVTVNDFFIENGTAYIAMEYIEGQTLKNHMAQMGGKLPAAQVFDMLRPVMTSLAQVHNNGMIHRDISPDNIMISKEGYVKLLDFGAAREFADSGDRSLSIMLKPGFAPEEQYRSRGVQGPWTDIYALCATMYKAITGVTPDESSERMRRDEVKRPSELGVAIPSALESVLMKGMAVLQEDRWQSVDELMTALNEVQGYSATSPGLVTDARVVTTGSPTEARVVTPSSSTETGVVTPGAPTEIGAVTLGSSTETGTVTPGSSTETGAFTPGSSTNPSADAVIASYSSQQSGTQKQFESVSRSETNHQVASVLYTKSESKSKSKPESKIEAKDKSKQKPESKTESKTESDPELTSLRRSIDSDLQLTLNRKKNPIVSWLVKNKIAAAFGSIAVVFMGIAFYQMVAGINDRTYRDANSNMTESGDAEEDNVSKEAIDSSNSSDNNSQSTLPPPNLTIGQRDVPFGEYMWRVLDIQDGKALLLSEEIIEKRAYHNEMVDITWEDCDLRAYLNGLFLESFTQEEQDAIIEVAHTNDNNQWFETEGGEATRDKIFLLSIEEALTFFGEGRLPDKPTDGRYSYSTQYGARRQAKYGDDWSWWWLRSPGYLRKYAADVNFDGAIFLSGINVTHESGGVRPALWLDVSDGANSSNNNSSDSNNAGGNNTTDNNNGLNNATQSLQRPTDLTVGQRDVPFGEYLWRVLDIQDGKALLLSEEIVSESAMNQEDKEYNWENCDLRNYLNETFLQSFTEEEQNAIVEVTNNNDENQLFGTGGGEATIDKIFLLSLEEVINYFGGSGQLEDSISVTGRIYDEYSQDRKAKSGNDWFWWWLRSSGSGDSTKVVDVDFDGGINLGGSDSIYESGGVRPALWIDISVYAYRESVIPTNLTVGQRNVLYGEYTWRVLEIQDGNALLLSEEIIEQRAYHNEFGNSTWKDCDLRKYLNETFLQSFTQEERDAIVEVTNSNEDNPWHDTEGGEATKEKIFLLSIEEVVDYFGDSGLLDVKDSIWRIKDQYNEARKAKYENDFYWWWLRSPGWEGSSAAYVLSDGDLDLGGSNVDDREGGVRPALWLHQ